MLISSRLSCMLLVILLFCTGAAEAQDSGGKLIYCRNGTLYSVAITSEGKFRQGQMPHKIARLPAQTVLDEISVSADGNLLAISVSSKDGQNTCLWTVADKAGAKLARLTVGSTPRFAPTGRLLAYTTPASDLCLLNLATGAQRVLRRGADSPSWSADGSEVALRLDADDHAEQSVIVADAATGKQVRFQKQNVCVEAALLSPDGRYLAYSPHLSRPKLPGIVEDRRSGTSFILPLDGSPVLDWSADSRYLLWTSFSIDPDNDGCWLWEEIWETAMNKRRSRRIDAGRNARFAPDGRHILYIRTEARRHAQSLGLYITEAHSRKRLLEKCDDVFAVWKSTQRVDIANAH